MKINSFSLVCIHVFLLCLAGCVGIDPARETHQSSITVTKLISSTNSWDGAVLPAYPTQQPNVTILRIRIPPGARLHTHRHPVINAGILISGELTVKIPSGPTLHLAAGDPIIEVVNTLHYGVNEGKTPAEIIVFYAGTLDDPTSILDSCHPKL
jgi:quercetin dioxygenase-like cupin family protein